MASTTTTGIGLDGGENLFDLPLAAHQGPEMLDHLDILELGNRRPGDAVDGLAGGVGNQMKMESFHG